MNKTFRLIDSEKEPTIFFCNFDPCRLLLPLSVTMPIGVPTIPPVSSMFNTAHALGHPPLLMIDPPSFQIHGLFILLTLLTPPATLLRLGHLILYKPPFNVKTQTFVLPFLDPDRDGTQNSLRTEIEISGELLVEMGVVGRPIREIILDPAKLGQVGVNVAIGMARRR